MAAVESGVAVLVEARDIILEFQGIIRRKALDDLDAWITKARVSLVASFANGVSKDKAAVAAAIALPWSNGQTEGQICKLKLVKRQMYGRGNLDLLQARVIGLGMSGAFIEYASDPATPDHSTALTRAGATNTKSGTWLRNMALNAMPGTSLMSKLAFEKHEAALHKLGLIDGNDKPTWFTDGKPDLIKMLSIAGDNAAKIPLTERAGYEKQLFGTQGFGGFALLADPAVKQQIASLMKDMNSSEFKNRYASFMEDYAAGSPVQKARQSWADLQNVLMDLGSSVLPGVTRGRGVDEVLTGIQALFGSAGAFQRMNDDQKVALKGITDGLDIFIGRLKGIAGAISGFFGGGGPGAAAPLPYGHPMHPSGLGPQSPLYPHQSQADTPVHIKTAVYLDGRIIGETISSELASLSTFPRQAPFSDTYLGWAAPDYNFGTG